MDGKPKQNTAKREPCVGLYYIDSRIDINIKFRVLGLTSNIYKIFNHMNHSQHFLFNFARQRETHINHELTKTFLTAVAG